MRLRPADRAGRSQGERRGGACLRSGSVLLVWVFAIFSGPALGADAGEAWDEALAAEALVRARYYEGMPEQLARDCSQVCVAHLLEMLANPAEVSSHANILYVLGYSSHPGAHEALAAYAAHEPEGRVSGAVYNARVQLLHALGARARRDPRALRLLVERLERAEAGAEAPRWWVGPLRGEALREVMLHGVLRGLALSGTPEAGARLRAREAAASADGLRLAGLREALDLHERAAALPGRDTGAGRP